VTTRSGEDLLARSRARKTAWLAARLDGLAPEDLVVLDRAARIIDELLLGDRAPRDPDRASGAT
jgi:hypothetical protein